MDDYEMDKWNNEIWIWGGFILCILEYGFKVKLINDSPNEEQKDYSKWKMIMNAPNDSDYKGGSYYINVEFLKIILI